MASYYVYILQCSDGTLYTGSTTDVVRRLQEHNEGGIKSARYTRARRPVRLIYQERCADRSTALRREHAIKQLTRQEKLTLSDPHTG